MWSCVRIKGEVLSKIDLSHLPNSFPTDQSKVVPLLQFFFLCVSMALYEVFVIICSSSLFLEEPREGCAL